MGLMLTLRTKNNQPMTKAQLIDEISSKTGIPRPDVGAILEAFMRSVKSSMLHQKPIYLRGFGSFILKKRARKTARIISKNKSLIIPEHFIPAFKPAKSFANRIKETPVSGQK